MRTKGSGDSARGRTFGDVSLRKSYSNHTAAAGNRRHDRKGITVFKHGGFFLEVAHVLFVDIDVHEGEQLALVSIKGSLQFEMPRTQAAERLSQGFCESVDQVW